MINLIGPEIILFWLTFITIQMFPEHRLWVALAGGGAQAETMTMPEMKLTAPTCYAGSGMRTTN